jgi:hypothetical protein
MWDRTIRNPNLLYWHKTLYFIDHGAALYFHHDWPNGEEALNKSAESAFPAIRKHVLLPWANAIEKAAAASSACLNREIFEDILANVPEDWLPPDANRAGYVNYFTHRLATSSNFVQEALRARAQLL